MSTSALFIGPEYRAFLRNITPLELLDIPLADGSDVPLTLEFRSTLCHVPGWAISAEVCSGRVNFELDLACEDANQLDSGPYQVSIYRTVDEALVKVGQFSMFIAMP